MDSFRTTAAITAPDYETACPHRMECGVCRLLLMRCPICAYTISPTWDLNRITCDAGSTEAHKLRED